MATPYQPQGLTAEQADGNILLTWMPSLGATGYQIQRSTDGLNFTDLATTTQITNYVDPLPGVGIMYWYQVAAIATFGAYARVTVTFSGQPVASDTIMIANVTLTAGMDFLIGGTVADTITNLINAINGNTTLRLIVIATFVGSVVTIESLVQGTIGNGLEFSNALTNTVGTPFSSGINPVMSVYSSIVQMVAAPPSEMSLFELRLRSQQTADRVNSQFVTVSEWNAFLRLAIYELYDLLITSYEDLYSDQFVFINTNAVTQNYPLPDGVSNYLGGTFPNALGATTPANAFYKLAGVDLGVNTSNNAWVTLLRFDFIQRNKYVYPNSTSTIYGVYNMRYRLMGKNINIIPTPAGNQQLRLWYAPRLPALLSDTDLTTVGFSGWLRYPIVRAAKYALDKEEGSDTSKLDAELVFLKQRIEQASQNRDIGQSETISETRIDPVYGGNSFAGGGGSPGGW